MHACVGVWLDTFNNEVGSHYNRWEIIILLTRANKRLSQIEKLLRKLKLKRKRKRKESKRIATCKEHLRETRQEYDPTISQTKQNNEWDHRIR